VHARADDDAARPRHEQAKGHGLRIAVCKLAVAGLGEKQLAPVGSQRGEGLAVFCERLGHFVAQQAAQARADFGQLLG
jgi:hypothetical protein